MIIGEKYANFIVHHYKFIENDKIEEGNLLISPDPIYYHVEKSGKDSFKKLERSLIHTCRPGHEKYREDEIEEHEIEEDGELKYWN